MRNYLKNFSIKEILSALVSSMVCVAFIFSYIVFVEKQSRTVEVILLFILNPTISLVISHRFYLLEHGYRNRFFGRIIQDIIIIILNSILCIISTTLVETIHTIGFISNFFIAFFVIFLLTELILTLINRLLIHMGFNVW